MSQKLETIADEISRARDIMLMLTERVPYIQSKPEGDAAKLLLQTMGIDTLKWAGNAISKFLDEGDVFPEGDDEFKVTAFPGLKELKLRTDQLDSVIGWLKDPYIYDSRKELRDSALMGLRKSLMVIENVMDFTAKAGRF